MTSVSAGHIILTPTQPVGSGRPQRESNLGSHKESRALPTELPRPTEGDGDIWGQRKTEIGTGRRRQRDSERQTDRDRETETDKQIKTETERVIYN